MKIRRMSSLAASALLACLNAAPAAAQFDPLHNHLVCHQMGGAPIHVRFRLDDQFGTALATLLKPAYLCLPTQKTCCDPGQPACREIPCPPDPSPNQPAPVDHFKCYWLLGVTKCVDPNCVNLDQFPHLATIVDLADQLKSELNKHVASKPKLLCLPVLKEIPGATTTSSTTTSTSVTTTTSTSTTSTTVPCHLDESAAPVCTGSCPTSDTVCVADALGCNCHPIAEQCAGSVTACAGLCRNPGAVCGDNPLTGLCGCFIPCGSEPALCATGSCPVGLTCTLTSADGCICL
jgi:hypothetical protein